MGLVDYASSSDDEALQEPIKRARTAETSSSASSTTVTETRPRPKPPRARRLPRLPGAYAGNADDPSVHQGRARTRAFVSGDWYAHVYVELELDSAMKAALENVLTAARASVSVEVHSLLDEGRLHVSLTHPLALRGELARTFATRVSALATQMRPFTLSLVSEQPKVYHNTAVPRRAFIAARVGAGRDGLETMLKPIRSLLAPHRVEAYFDKPEWHASFAWCLDEEPAATAEGEDNETEGEAEVDTSPFPSSLLGEVASVLESLSRRAWDVDTICVRVGPTVTRVDLPPGH